MIYLDNNATTPVLPEVIEAMRPYWSEQFGNPSSMHGLGAAAERALQDARHSIAETLSVSAEEIIFTSGASESMHTALRGFAGRNSRFGKHIVTTPVEHECTLAAIQMLEEQGFEVTYLKTDAVGAVTPQQVQSAVRDDTVLVSVMQVNNELGTRNPVAEIARAVKSADTELTRTGYGGPFVVVDGVQAYGKLPVELDAIDAYAISAHKIHGPKGCGALYLARKRQERLNPLITGGGQEFGLRAGTQNVPAVSGFARAARLACEHREERTERMRDLHDQLRTAIDGMDAAVLNSPADGAPSTVSAAFPGVPAETLLHALEERGVYVSTGSACSSNTSVVSHVLSHITDRGDIKKSTLRFGISHMNTESEIEQTIAALTDAVAELRAALPSSV